MRHSSTLSRLVVSSDSTSASAEPIQVEVIASPRLTSRRERKVENAIYSHIRAIRTLGRLEINTDEIADALSLPVLVVNQAISSLKKKGVKITNG
jgi:predicted transcriptional regulator